ncbi:Zinc finger FYVE domain-containing protein 26 [Podila humilis]|nr:Zinc finger FYVE domain-containing protein 26 [Podila humilis]
MTACPKEQNISQPDDKTISMDATVLPPRLLSLTITKASATATTTAVESQSARTTTATSSHGSTLTGVASPTLSISSSLPTAALATAESNSMTVGGAILHKKDSGTSITATVAPEPSLTATSVAVPTTAATTTTATAATTMTATTTNTPMYVTSPAGRVLSRPLSTSHISSAPLLASPHIIPTPQKYAGFNLATLGQLSPSASNASMTISRTDSLSHQAASYFSPSITGLSDLGGNQCDQHHRTAESLFAPGSDSMSTIRYTNTGATPSMTTTTTTTTTTATTMCGSDAISLLDLEDTHDDLVMIDSNGNSIGGGVTGSALVGETMASASAIVSTHKHHSQHYPYYHQQQHHSHFEGGGGGGGDRHSSYAVAGLASLAALSTPTSTPTNPGGAVGALTMSLNQHGGGGGGASTSGGTVGSGGGNGTLASSGTSTPSLYHASSQLGSTRHSSTATLTSQAKLDAMQRVAMIAAIQQNGGAKILAAQQRHRVGRRQDRPSRNIRFGDFHRICEVEYEFETGKPLIANGRTLLYSTCVARIDGDDKRDEMLYLFSDVLVTGTKIRTPLLISRKPDTQTVSIEVTPDEDMKSADVESTESNESPETTSDESFPSSDCSSSRSSTSDGDHENLQVNDGEKDETSNNKQQDQEMAEQDQVERHKARLRNPYAGQLENQCISRLTEVRADTVEDKDEPLLAITTATQREVILLFESHAKRDKFITLLNDASLAHKHHLLFQSKYWAEMKKLKRHSAFPFDTSFLKTWGITSGLHLGSNKPGSGPGGFPSSVGNMPGANVAGGGTLSASPLASPNGGVYDSYQYQQHMNRPQSMAGSLFSFAMNGGSFPFSDHSKDSSYATLKGSSAANALQYHHQQQQMLQHQIQMQANRLSNASIASHMRSGGGGGADRSSSGSTFDPMWFLKGAAASAQDTVRPSSKWTESSMEASSSSAANSVMDESIDTEQNGADISTSVDTGAGNEGSTGLRTSKSGTNLPALLSSGANRLSTSSFSLLSSSSNNLNNLGTLRNGAGWVRDEDASVCMVCTTTKFGVLVRKHHCRLCGRVICWKCCQMKDASLLDTTASVEKPGQADEKASDTPSSPVTTSATNSRQEQTATATAAAGVLSIQTLKRPIRVCLDCIENENLQDTGPPNSPQSQGPSPTLSSFPLQGVLGKFLQSTSSHPQSVTTSTTATGSTFSISHPFSTKNMLSSSSSSGLSPAQISGPYPRKTNNRANNRPLHHRASLYRIDVDIVGEEDEEDQEEQQDSTVTTAFKSAIAASFSTGLNLTTNNQEQGEDEDNDQDMAELLKLKDEHERMLGDAQTAGLSLDCDDDDEHEEEEEDQEEEEEEEGQNLEDVNSQILNLECEVESLMLHKAAAPLMFGARASHTGRIGGGRTGYRIPQDVVAAAAEQAGLKMVTSERVEEKEEEEEEEEVEKSMEELLAEQDAQLQSLMTQPNV